jgi:hypothetical protein
MPRVQTDNINKEPMAFIRSWFDLLAQGDMERACKVLDKPNS